MSDPDVSEETGAATMSSPFHLYLPGTKDREPEFIATVMVETNGDFITQKSRAVLERIRRALLRERELESALHDMLSLYDNTDNQSKPGAYAERARSLLSNAEVRHGAKDADLD